MNDTLNYLKKDPVYRKWHHNNITFSMAYFYSERFLIEFSHDEVVHGKATIINKMWGTYEQKLAQARTLYLYMFTHPEKTELSWAMSWPTGGNGMRRRRMTGSCCAYPAHDAFHQLFRIAGRAVYERDRRCMQNDYSWESFEWIDADNAGQESCSRIMRKGADRTTMSSSSTSRRTRYAHEVFGVAAKRHVPQRSSTRSGAAIGGTLAEQPQHCPWPLFPQWQAIHDRSRYTGLRRRDAGSGKERMKIKELAHSFSSGSIV